MATLRKVTPGRSAMASATATVTARAPASGTRGCRVLDGLRFACEVVAVDCDGATLSVRFLDDSSVEEGVELDEFEWADTSAHELATPQSLESRWLSGSNEAAQTLARVAAYVDHLEWVTRLAGVCREWRRSLLAATQWQTLRLPRDLTGHASAIFRMLESTVVGQSTVVADCIEKLVLSDSDATDEHVLTLVHKCPRLQHIDLQRCSRISFMLVYELLRITRERSAAGSSHLESLDLWLCQGISPSYLSQLSKSSRPPPLVMRSPGFYFFEVTQQVASTLVELSAEIADWLPIQLRVLWLPADSLLNAIAARAHDAAWSVLRKHAPLFEGVELQLVPLVVFDSVWPSTAAYFTRLGLPASPFADLGRLVREWEDPLDQPGLMSVLDTMMKPQDALQSVEQTSEPAPDPLAALAERVFAMLRRTTEQLQSQVEHLERQVAVMAHAKAQAEQEYKHAQRELHRVATEADRALLSLATSSDPTVAPDSVPPTNGVITVRAEDAMLPPLPSYDTMKRLASELETHHFSILDGFLGDKLSRQARRDVELLYTASRVADADASTELRAPETASTAPRPPPPPRVERSSHFKLGELAGGATGHNVRYQMAHVRGDYVLWMDESDAFCPTSVCLVLRQLDRLILERLSTESHELSMSSLLRKKAMATCYPGKHRARYTRHCDNPNKNGRKLTAILYLNPDWDASQHGGQLVIYRHDGRGEVAVAPLLDRLLLFFSDPRVPHEVSSCLDDSRDRFAVTVWYLDYDEFMHAQVLGTQATHAGAEDERQRITREMEARLERR